MGEREDRWGPVQRIGEEEVQAAVKKMKCGKAVGPDGTPVEVWRHAEERAVDFFC